MKGLVCQADEPGLYSRSEGESWRAAWVRGFLEAFSSLFSVPRLYLNQPISVLSSLCLLPS